MGAGAGFGFIKDGENRIKQNRNLLGRDRSLKKIYTGSKKLLLKVDKEDVNARVEHYRKRQSYTIKYDKMKTVLLSSIITGLIIAIIISDSDDSVAKTTTSNQNYFKTIYYNTDNAQEQLRIDYYRQGRRASETRYKDGLKHQNSESYYPSGEQFRSALYDKDTLIIDLYFYKSGDTIRNFPKLKSLNKAKHIELTKDSLRVSFDYFEGKVLPNSYKEEII